MIVPMVKYTFLVFYKEYDSFLENLRELGVVHVVQKEIDASQKVKLKYDEIKHFEKAIHFLEKRDFNAIKPPSSLNGREVLNDIIQKQKELEDLTIRLEETKKAFDKAIPWGDFSPELIQKLKDENIHLDFYQLNKKQLLEFENAAFPFQVISEQANRFLILVVKTDDNQIDINIEKLNLPTIPYTKLEKQITNLEQNILALNNYFDELAGSSLPILEAYKNELINSLQFEQVALNTTKEAEEKLMVLEGWIPKSKNISINQHLKKNKILFVKNKPTPNDKIPILLKNNRFGKLFEPIGSMFSLPDYAELDLTVFFAPFFMLFFGFCLGDAGYGLLFLIGGGLYKLKAPKEFKPYLSLIQFLGVATIIFGTISGTFFGVNLIETEIAFTDNFRTLFLNPDKMFNLALILGGIQIIFGMFIRAINQTKQYGFIYSLATCGWLVILLGSIGYTVLSANEIIPKNKTILYIILSTGGFFVLFFSDPRITIFARLGKGVWDVYSTVTGIFGDLLSYIRLFALGLSSAILGFVINDIGLQILGSSKIIGPVFFVVFLIIGHTLNILISSLGSFVHPMRLTFVEFYKSAGFKGGGEAYKPFKKNLPDTTI